MENIGRNESRGFLARIDSIISVASVELDLVKNDLFLSNQTHLMHYR